MRTLVLASALLLVATAAFAQQPSCRCNPQTRSSPVLREKAL